MTNIIQLPTLQVSDKNTMLIQANIQKALAQLQAVGGMPYTPGDASDWAPNAPSTMQQALDRMAALLFTLNSNTPIP